MSSRLSVPIFKPFNARENETQKNKSESTKNEFFDASSSQNTKGTRERE